MSATKIAPAEWEVMEVLWDKSPLSAAEVADALKEDTTWHPKTIYTLLDRLVQKEVLSREKRAGCYRYAPLVDRAECIQEEGKSFLKRFFGGDLTPMVASFLDGGEATPEDVKQLRKLLDEWSKRKDKP